MSGLRPPGLGPIIGHTTEDSCRLWIRANDPGDEGANLASGRRTVGIVGVLTDDRKSIKPSSAFYFRLQREYDRTGTFVLGKDVALGKHETDGVPVAERGTPFILSPDTIYIVRLATLSVDDPMPDADNLSDRELAQRLPPVDNMARMLIDLPAGDCEATFRTFPRSDQRADKLTFLVGSCRYPGLLWKIKEADRIFGPMVEHLRPNDGRAPARFTLMVGDQIYADMFNRLIPIGRADTYKEFQDRYHAAFELPNMRELLRMAPSYMILDDHEIEDNWTQDRLGKPGEHHLFTLAIGAYMSYQWSHSPRTYGQMLYYKFGCAGYPFFVMDTRTQRYMDDEGLEDNHMLGHPTIDPAHPSQLDRFLDWLGEQQADKGNTPKFVVSSSVFAPNALNERLDHVASDGTPVPASMAFSFNRQRRATSDSWPAYPQTRSKVLNHIVDKRVQNVVFLTGDIHCSNIAQMRFELGGNDSGLIAYDITSSAFYWPFPFADGDPNSYVHDSTLPGQRDPFPVNGGEMHYRAWSFTQEDNFCRIEIDKQSHSLRVQYYDSDGKQLSVADPAGTKMLTNTLDLAAWT